LTELINFINEGVVCMKMKLLWISSLDYFKDKMDLRLRRRIAAFIFAVIDGQ